MIYERKREPVTTDERGLEKDTIAWKKILL